MTENASFLIFFFSSFNNFFIALFIRSGRGVQHYVIKFVSDLQQVGGFLRILPVSSTNKTDRHDITEILLKVPLQRITKQWSTLKLIVNYTYWSVSFVN